MLSVLLDRALKCLWPHLSSVNITLQYFHCRRVPIALFTHFIYALFSQAIQNEEFVDYGHLDLYPPDPRVHSSDDATFYLELHRRGLLFTMKVMVNPSSSDSITPPSFYIQLDQRINDTLRQQGVRFSAIPDRSRLPAMPSADDPELAIWHVQNYRLMPWTLLTLGKKPGGAANPALGRRITVSTVTWVEMHHRSFDVKTNRKVIPLTNHSAGGEVFLVGQSLVSLPRLLTAPKF